MSSPRGYGIRLTIVANDRVNFAVTAVLPGHVGVGRQDEPTLRKSRCYFVLGSPSLKYITFCNDTNVEDFFGVSAFRLRDNP
jgi:hypothetical protein